MGRRLQRSAETLAAAASIEPCKELVVGFDGGNARNRHRRPERNFEVVAGEALDRDGQATRFAFVRNGGSEAVSAVDLALRHCGVNEATSVTVLTDGDAGFRAIHRQFAPHADLILDWFHISTRFKNMEQRAEGAIVIASWVFEEANLLVDIEKNHVPIVIVGRDLASRRISSVLVDNEAGGALAMRHLCELRHRRIAVIRGPEELFDSEPRWAGVRQTAAETGFDFDPELVCQLPGLLNPISGFEGGLRLTRKFLSSGRQFTAILAFDDLTALGVVRGLTDAGLRVPKDCSVLGFDDVLLAKVATPGLTTIRQPLKKMGLQAARWALQALDAKERARKVAPRLHKWRPESVVRGSTARPSRSITS